MNHKSITNIKSLKNSIDFLELQVQKFYELKKFNLDTYLLNKIFNSFINIIAFKQNSFDTENIKYNFYILEQDIKRNLGYIRYGIVLLYKKNQILGTITIQLYKKILFLKQKLIGIYNRINILLYHK